MAFDYLADVTDPVAPDEIVDWFATFQAWITGTVGWTVASGGGTTDLYIRSTGEAGGLTMLFVHIWRDGVNPSRVHLEVSDDAVPTHETTRGGYVDSGGVQFAYFMSADKDCIIIIWKSGVPGYRMVYGGLVWPFALTVTDETYHSIASAALKGTGASTILRNHDGTWDVDITNYHQDSTMQLRRDRYDGSFPLVALFANQNDEIAGEFKHISAEIGDGSVNLEDTLTTGYPGATTEWIILQDHTLHKFALRTGGVLPTGVPDGANFAHQAGVANSPQHFIETVLPGFLTGVGWTNLGDAGIGVYSRLFYCQGESATQEIYCIVSWSANYMTVWVQDDAGGTHRTDGAPDMPMQASWFPASYMLSADRDEIVFAIQDNSGYYYPFYLGMLVPFNPNLPSSPYSMVASELKTDTTQLLRGHNGNWAPGNVINFKSSHDSAIQNSQPNLFDATTYFAWPTWYIHSWAGIYGDGIGMPRYLKYSHAGISQLDTITINGQVYTLLSKNLAIRTT